MAASDYAGAEVASSSQAPRAAARAIAGGQPGTSRLHNLREVGGTLLLLLLCAFAVLALRFLLELAGHVLQ
jgi:hypothetical protein